MGIIAATGESPCRHLSRVRESKLCLGKTVGWTGGAKSEAEKALRRLNQQCAKEEQSPPASQAPCQSKVSVLSELAVECGRLRSHQELSSREEDAKCAN